MHTINKSDMLEVTRCKDCKYYDNKTFTNGKVEETFSVCTRMGGIQHLGLSGEAFCSFAERREDG